MRPRRFWLLFLLAACGSAPATDPFARGFAVAPISVDEFPGAATVLPVFSQPRDVPDWMVGERVLYGLRIEREGQTKRWLARITVTQPRVHVASFLSGRPYSSKLSYQTENGDEIEFESTWIEVGVEVFDAEGALLRKSHAPAAAEMLQRGFVDACTTARALIAQDPNRKVTSYPNEGRVVAGGLVALISFLELARNDTSLAPILWEVMERPSALALLADFGVKVGLRTEFEKAEPTTALDGRAAFRVPITVLVNEVEGLQCRFLVTEPKPPLRLGAGIVAIEACRPGDETTKLRIDLLGAELPEPAKVER